MTNDVIENKILIREERALLFMIDRINSILYCGMLFVPLFDQFLLSHSSWARRLIDRDTSVWHSTIA